MFKDVSLNGLQVDSGRATISKVVIAVDSGLSVIQKAVQEEADLLIVHHGLFWSEAQALIGPFGDKIRTLFEGKCSLYASHLPLDAHHDVGNNFELARFFELDRIQPFGDYKGQFIGAEGMTKTPSTLQNFVDRCRAMPGAITPLVLPFGPSKIEKVAFLSGSGVSAMREAGEKGIDLFISGEPKQEAYHIAKELNLNAIFAGHYATETFGVKALARVIEKDFEIKTSFIDEPTGI